MRRSLRVLQALAALVLLLSLGLGPVMDALTHGPGTHAAEADHAAWHAGRGEIWQADAHQHHDATDHDHSTSVILAAQATHSFEAQGVIELRDPPVLTGAIRDGLRRPPRGTRLTA
jgi:hypothetical protein